MSPGAQAAARKRRRAAANATERPRCPARRAAGLDACGERRRDDRRRATDRTHSRIRDQCRADNRDRDLGPGRQGAAQRKGHSSICTTRSEARNQPISRPLDARSGHHRRIGDMADDHPRTGRAGGCRRCLSMAGCRTVPSRVGRSVPISPRHCSRICRMSLPRSETDAERFRELGARPVTVSGNLKVDSPPPFRRRDRTHPTAGRDRPPSGLGGDFNP
jgi:hypothetical protein